MNIRKGTKRLSIFLSALSVFLSPLLMIAFDGVLKEVIGTRYYQDKVVLTIAVFLITLSWLIPWGIVWLIEGYKDKNE